MNIKETLPTYVEMVALVYHEARNVRQLLRRGGVSKAKFGALADHLPPDPQPAWERLIPLQTRAAETESAAAAANVFTEHFGCSVDDLATLFENSGWRHVPGCGGARWAAIATSVAGVGRLIDAADDSAADRVGEIESMRHNSGSVREKLARLKARPR
jgi:hypothetical protein